MTGRDAAAPSPRGGVKVGASGSLFYATRVDALRALHSDNPVVRWLSDDTRVVVSEPFRDREVLWREVREASIGLVRAGEDDLLPFGSRSP